MKVIRKLLTPNEVTPPSIRWNEGTDTVEQTPDGGVTWVETPELDPRHGNGFRRPPLTGVDARCDAAAREMAAWKEMYGIFIESTDALQFLAIILNILLLLAGGVGVLISLILLVFDALIFIGKENMEAAFSEEVWDGVMCIIYNNIGEDGQVSEADLSQIYIDIYDTYPGTVYNTLIEIGHLFGEVLLSNASVERSETGDCSECPVEWCYEWDPIASPWTLNFGTQGTRYVGFGADFDPSILVTAIEFFWTWNGSGAGGTAAAAIFNGSNYQTQIAYTSNIAALAASWTGETTLDGISITVNADDGSGGIVTITKVHLRSLGENPFGTDNCE